MTEIAPPPTPHQTSMDRFMEPPAAAASMNGDMEEEPIYDVSTDFQTTRQRIIRTEPIHQSFPHLDIRVVVWLKADGERAQE